MSFLNILLYLPRKVRDIIFRISLGMKMAFSRKSYLVRTGFVYSRIHDAIKNREGEFIPWMNYPIIHFLDERLDKRQSVFEYGSGASSMYLAQRVGAVTSVEYDQGWYQRIKELTDKQTNIAIHFVPLNETYYQAISRIGQGAKFDIVIVDGRFRVESAIFSFDYLTPEGVIVLDDSERPHYQQAYDFYHEKGYRHLTFAGLKPTGFGTDYTTIFYKGGKNCLGL